MNDDMRLMHELADIADRISMSRFGAEDLLVDTKPDLTPVTEADRAIEERIRAELGRRRPSDAVLGEEFGGGDRDGEAARWIIDPIDGTKSYVRGVPVFATLIALEREGMISAGLVSAPALGGRRWWAARGQGTHANGQVVRVSAVSRLEDAHLAYGGLGGWERAGLLPNFLSLARRCWRTRGFGDFWMHMLVAEGGADLAGELEVSVWDLAAVQVIVEEAGGTFSDLAGAPRLDSGSALSTNGLLHAEALGVLSDPPVRLPG